jgi:Uncharacterised nucleotidyltransferase
VTAAGPRVANWPEETAWLAALRTPAVASAWTLGEWNFVVRQARKERLLARLGHALSEAAMLDGLPPAVRAQLRGAMLQAHSRTRAMLWAVQRLPEMLQEPSYPLVLLKGAAYVAQDLPNGRGRLPSDLDILIPAAHLEHARFFLRQAGWVEAELSAPDVRYYEQWSHELPPMRHAAHGVELDVHHNLLPPRKGQMPDVERLLARLQPSGVGPWQVLGDVDQVLHCTAHLVREPEPEHRLRDLIDIQALIVHFAARKDFLQRLCTRATELHLQEELWIGVGLIERWLDASQTPVIGELRQQLAIAPQHGSAVGAGLKLRALAAVLRPQPPDEAPRLSKRLAALMVLADYHRTRLPWRVLIPHLWRKWRAGIGDAKAPDAAPTAP